MALMSGSPPRPRAAGVDLYCCAAAVGCVVKSRLCETEVALSTLSRTLSSLARNAFRSCDPARVASVASCSQCSCHRAILWLSAPMCFPEFRRFGAAEDAPSALINFFALSFLSFAVAAVTRSSMSSSSNRSRSSQVSAPSASSSSLSTSAPSVASQSSIDSGCGSGSGTPSGSS
jgi:hypothetical protein